MVSGLDGKYRSTMKKSGKKFCSCLVFVLMMNLSSSKGKLCGDVNNVGYRYPLRLSSDGVLEYCAHCAYSSTAFLSTRTRNF